MTSKKKFSPEFKGNFINGRFLVPKDASGTWVSKSPADFTDELGTIHYSYQIIDEVVSVARDAFKSWKKVSLAERAQSLKRYQEVLKSRQDEIAEIIAREVGKPLWESKTEVSAMINKVDVTLNDSMKLIESYSIPDIMPATVGTVRYKPLGVMAVVGPFNFPGHLANGHIVPALLTGNTVIFKPSEKSPIVGQLMAECFMEAGFPAGVFNLIQGEKETSRRLCIHEGVDGVLFTGSYEVGTRIKQDTLQQYWKLLALEMGGKNATIITEDADFEVALLETFTSSFITTGQRCSCTSRVFVHESIFEKFVKSFHEKAKKFAIGHPLDNPFMGSIIDSSIMDRYIKFMGIAEREGFNVLMRAKTLDLDYKGNYVTPSICTISNLSLSAAEKSVYQQTELFAPNVSIVGYSDLEEAVELANSTAYGLVASIFCQSKETYMKAWEGLEVGLVNWNRSTVGASSRLPFGGLKKSGNHFPTALTATGYCTYPVASLEVQEPKVNSATFLGLNW